MQLQKTLGRTVSLEEEVSEEEEEEKEVSEGEEEEEGSSPEGHLATTTSQDTDLSIVRVRHSHRTPLQGSFNGFRRLPMTCRTFWTRREEKRRGL